MSNSVVVNDVLLRDIFDTCFAKGKEFYAEGNEILTDEEREVRFPDLDKSEGRVAIINGTGHTSGSLRAAAMYAINGTLFYACDDYPMLHINQHKIRDEIRLNEKRMHAILHLFRTCDLSIASQEFRDNFGDSFKSMGEKLTSCFGNKENNNE